MTSEICLWHPSKHNFQMFEQKHFCPRSCLAFLQLWAAALHCGRTLEQHAQKQQPVSTVIIFTVWTQTLNMIGILEWGRGGCADIQCTCWKGLLLKHALLFFCTNIVCDETAPWKSSTLNGRKERMVCISSKGFWFLCARTPLWPTQRCTFCGVCVCACMCVSLGTSKAN